MISPPPSGFIHRFVPAPGAQRTLVLLHGTGGNENDLIDLGRTLSPESALLSPRGKVLENGMSRFFRRLAEGVFDVPDLKARARELAGFLEEAVDSYGLQGTALVAVGHSNGANIAGGLLLLRPGLLNGAVLWRPMVPFEPDVLPTLTGTRVLIVAGRQDRTVPPGVPEHLAGILGDSGAEVALEWTAGGHGLTEEDVEVARGWLG